MLIFFFSLLVNSPFYPHWLEFRNRQKKTNDLLMSLRGQVLETGCGAVDRKEFALLHNKNIKNYLATDNSSWDQEFEMHKKKANYLGPITQLLYGKPRDQREIDKVCDALDLPFKNESFDSYCCFSLLEHLNDPDQFFRELYRVLKKGGVLAISAPFLYEEHGGSEKDFQRFTKGGFYALAQRHKFKIISITTDSYIGTSLAILINHFIIRKIMEGNLLVKIIVSPLSPFIFFFSNSLGFLLDKIDRDERFAAEYFVLLKKE